MLHKQQKMKQILITFPGLTLNLDEGAKHRLNCYINSYSDAGYSVKVLVFDKSLKSRKQLRPYLNEKATWILLPYIIPISKNYILAKIALLYMKIATAIVAHMTPFDIIQMELYSLFSFICPKRKTIFITDFHGDMPYEQIENKNYDPKSKVIKFMFDQQKESILTSDVCIVVSNKLKQQLELNTAEPIDKYAVVSCAVDLNRFYNASRASLDLNERIVLGYCGGLQNWQNVDKIIENTIRLHSIDKRIYLAIYTNSPVDRYKQLLDRLGPDNYLIKGLKTNEVPSYLKLLDAGFLLRSDLVLNKVSSPTKICEYLAAGAPLICTQFSGDYERVIEHEINGFVTDSTTFTNYEIERLHIWLNNVKNNRQSFSKRCISSVKDRQFSVEFNSLLNIISDIN